MNDIQCFLKTGRELEYLLLVLLANHSKGLPLGLCYDERLTVFVLILMDLMQNRRRSRGHGLAVFQVENDISAWGRRFVRILLQTSEERCCHFIIKLGSKGLYMKILVVGINFEFHIELLDGRSTGNRWQVGKINLFRTKSG